jgi:hypothetical protein
MRVGESTLAQGILIVVDIILTYAIQSSKRNANLYQTSTLLLLLNGDQDLEVRTLGASQILDQTRRQILQPSAHKNTSVQRATVKDCPRLTHERKQAACPSSPHSSSSPE